MRQPAQLLRYNSSMDAPDLALRQRIAAVMGKPPTSWRHAAGYTPAQRWIVGFDDGTSCFAKSATNSPHSPMDEWLRREHHVYSHLQADFMPRMLGWEDDGVQPLLILEDLSAAHWPPPWRPGDIEAVFATLAKLHTAGLDVPTVAEIDPGLTTHWLPVRDDPGPFLSLGLCTQPWLQAALPLLIDAARVADLSGPSLLHLDTRSDNICFVGSRALLIDWNFAARGNPDVDIAACYPACTQRADLSPKKSCQTGRNGPPS